MSSSNWTFIPENSALSNRPAFPWLTLKPVSFMSPEVPLSSISLSANRGNVRKVGVAETLTNADTRREIQQTMWPKISILQSCDQSFQRERRRVIAVSSQASRRYRQSRWTRLQELWVHLKSEDVCRDVEHGAKGQNRPLGSEISVICVSGACGGPIKALICSHCTSNSFEWEKLSEIIMNNYTKKVLH